MKAPVASTFFFSVLVTLGMNALDLAYHVLTSTVIHLNYVAVKFTIVFLAVFLTAHVVGIGMKHGIFTAVLGPFAFWVYYVKAYATIPREVFIVDEAIGYFFIHAFFLLLVYCVAYWSVLGAPVPHTLSRRSRMVALSVTLLVGLVYAFVPQATLQLVGLGLELQQLGTTLLGLVSLSLAVSLAFWKEHSRDILRYRGFSFVVALSVLTVDLGYLMLTKVVITEDYGTVFFSNVAYVFSLLLLLLTTVFFVTLSMGTTRRAGMLAGILVGIHLIVLSLSTMVLPFSVAHSIVLAVIVISIYTLARRLHHAVH